MNRYWQKEYECMSRDELTKLQSQRLVKLVKRVYENVPHYRAKMDACRIKPEDINGIEDLSKLPFTYKTDLRDTYPFGLLAVPMKDIVRVHASSGTTGKQTVVAYTKNDLNMWGDCIARAMTAAGGSDESIVHISYGYGLFTGGLGAHYGAERMGAATVPVSTGNTQRQINLMKDFGATLIACTPSYMLYLAEEMEKMGVKPSDLKLKSGVFGAEPWTEEIRKEIEDKMHISAFDIYGLSEIMGPGVAYECSEKHGMHISEDCFIPEIIDTDTGEVLPYGSTGELVFTTITKEGLPLIRYRTKDITRLNCEKCSCGRTFLRMERVTGRSDDMLIIRGVNVFPSQVESVLLGFGELAPQYQIVVGRSGVLDTMEVRVEMTKEIFSDSMKNIASIEDKIKKQLESVLGIATKVKLVEPYSLERSEGKAKRVIDLRKQA